MLWNRIVEKYDQINFVIEENNHKSITIIGSINGVDEYETLTFKHGEVGKSFLQKISMFVGV